jgi:hypothetical protein
MLAVPPESYVLTNFFIFDMKSIEIEYVEKDVIVEFRDM